MTTQDPTPSSVRHFGYPISTALYERVKQTIQLIQEEGDTRLQCQEAADTLGAITDAGFYAYYVRPAELAGLSPNVKRASDAGIHAVQKGIHMVIRKLLKKRPQQDLNRLACNLSYLVCVDPNHPDQAYACFRLEESLYQRVVANMQRVHQDPEVARYRADVIASVEDLIAAGIDNFYTRPVEQAQISGLTRKAADLGIHTVQKGTNAVVHRLFRDMDHATLLPMAEYFETLLHSQLQTYRHRYQKASA